MTVQAASSGAGTAGRGDETSRALARYAVLDTGPDADFDEIAELARELTGAAVAGIGFRHDGMVWFKSQLGLRLTQCPAADFPAPGSTGPWRIGGQVFGHFAAAPLSTTDGFHLGELFVADRAEQPDDRAGATSSLGALARLILTRLELRRTLLSYHAVVDGVGHVVFQLDEDDRLISLTPTWSQLTGYGVVRSTGRRLEDFVHPAERETVSARLRELRGSTRSSTFECRLLRLMGGDVPVEIICRPMLDEALRHRGSVGVVADITERKMRAAEAQHAQKLEALGRLSAGLAHELNTPMQFIADNTRFVAESWQTLFNLTEVYRQALAGADGGAAVAPEVGLEQVRHAEEQADVEFLSQEVPPAVQETLSGVDRVATLVHALKRLTRPGETGRSTADLNEALQAAVTVAESQVRHHATLTVDLAELPALHCNISDLNQVILGVIQNAADAIEDKGGGGTITVTSRLDGDSVRIAIRDTGTGIPEEIRTRIFEPFFTTKEVGRGTGQGLALARAIVHDDHHGRIEVASEVGVGTTVTIVLPVGDDGRRGPSGTSARPARPDGAHGRG